MHSWIFRNREHLRLVYGAVRPAVEDEFEEEPLVALASEPGSSAEASTGTIERTHGDVLLVPMPRVC